MPRLEFFEANHEYRLDGVRVPSVTQVLQSAGIIDYSSVPEEWRNFALTRGSAVHHACRLLDENDLDRKTLDSSLDGYIRAYERFLADSGARPISIEQCVSNELMRYAGTLDRIYDVGGMRVLADLKTSLVPNWTGIQISAYAACISGVDTFLKRWGVALRDDGTYRIETFEDTMDWDIFVSALAVHNWKKNHE